MLPDDYVAIHLTGDDDAGSLAIEIVLGSGSADDDEAALENAASWVAARTRRHDIDIDQLSAEEWRQGGTGLIGENQLRPSPSPAWSGFDWDHFLALIDESRSRWQPLGARTSGDDEEGSSEDPRLRELRRAQSTALTS